GGGEGGGRRVGRDRAHDAATDADEVVLDAEVGQEGDVAVAHSSGSPRRANFSTAATSPSRSWTSAWTATARPTDSATREVSGPIDTAGALPPVQAYARAADADASTTRAPSCGAR